jgi:hypothetical protein
MADLIKIIDEVSNFNIIYTDNSAISIPKTSINEIVFSKLNGTVIFFENNDGTHVLKYSEVEDVNNVGHAFVNIYTFQSYISLLFDGIVDIPLLDSPMDSKSYVRKNGAWLDVSSSVKLAPITGLTFSGQFNLTNSYQTSYVTYVSNTALTPTIATGALVGASARLVVDAGAVASLVTTNLGTLRAGSDTFTVSKLNEIVLVKEEEGLYYNIKVLN